jgi:hypothetical protein
MFIKCFLHLAILVKGIRSNIASVPFILLSQNLMPNSLFTFTAINSFDIPNEDEGVITVTIDATEGTMVVTCPEMDPVVYPLVDEEAEPLPRAIYINTESSPMTFQVGAVTYARQGLNVQYFPLNEYEIGFTVAENAGHLGILDIRDNARLLPKHFYYFDMMPVILSIEGNYLTVKTLQWASSDPFGPWHEII